MRKSVQLQRQTMAGQIAEEIRHRILAGDYVDGEQLMQEQMAAEFGVSKVPVREALHMLEAEGLVQQKFHKGAVVAGLEPEQLMEIFEMRCQIEKWLLGLAMKNATPEDIENARTRNKMLADSTEPVEAWNLNWKLHEALYLPANKPYALEHLGALHSKTARYVRLQYSKATSQQRIVEEHGAIIDAFEKKDPKTPKMLEKHILEAAGKLTLRLIEVRDAEKS